MAAQEWYDDGLRFTCTQCGNCCTGPPGYVWFNPDEADAIAAHMKLDSTTFYQRYAHKISGRWSLNEEKTPDGYDCVFLRRTPQGQAQCAIYPVRPKQCRTWPFWPENLHRKADWNRAARTCPGIDHGKLYRSDQIRVIRSGQPG